MSGEKRTPKYAREQIELALRTERGAQRCSLVKKLNEQFHKDHADLYKRTDQIRDELLVIEKKESELRTLRNNLNTEANKIRAKISELKITDKIATTTSLESRKGACGLSELHQSLAEFDRKTSFLIGKLYIDEVIDPNDFLETDPK